jgi:hypothetical protein
MNSHPTIAQIPVINGIVGLSIAEKVALGFIHNHRRCANEVLAHLLDFSIRGTEQLLLRLRESGHIRQVGRARCLELAFNVDSRSECGRASTDGLAKAPKAHTECGHPPAGGLARATKSHIGCANAPSGGVASAPKRVPGEAPSSALAKHELQFEQFVDLHLDQFQICLGRGELDGALEHLKVLRERLEHLDARLPKEIPRAEISHALRMVALEENRVRGFKWVSSHAKCMTREDARLMTAKVRRADEAQLARLTEYVKANPVVEDTAAVLALLGGAG